MVTASGHVERTKRTSVDVGSSGDQEGCHVAVGCAAQWCPNMFQVGIHISVFAQQHGSHVVVRTEHGAVQ
jgi:hypothetical protein